MINYTNSLSHKLRWDKEEGKKSQKNDVESSRMRMHVPFTLYTHTHCIASGPLLLDCGRVEAIQMADIKPHPPQDEAYRQGHHNCCTQAAQANCNAPGVDKLFPAACLCLGRRFHS